MRVKLATVTPLEVWMRVKDGRTLQAQIVVAGTTQRGLAEKIKRSRGLVGDLCSGRRLTCSTETAHLICSALGATLDTLFWPESSNQPQRHVNAKLAERKRRVSAPVVTTRRRGRVA